MDMVVRSSTLSDTHLTISATSELRRRLSVRLRRAHSRHAPPSPHSNGMHFVLLGRQTHNPPGRV